MPTMHAALTLTLILTLITYVQTLDMQQAPRSRKSPKKKRLYPLRGQGARLGPTPTTPKPGSVYPMSRTSIHLMGLGSPSIGLHLTLALTKTRLTNFQQRSILAVSTRAATLSLLLGGQTHVEPPAGSTGSWDRGSSLSLLSSLHQNI